MTRCRLWTSNGHVRRTHPCVLHVIELSVVSVAVAHVGCHPINRSGDVVDQAVVSEAQSLYMDTGARAQGDLKELSVCPPALNEK
jgi:hypothetical protein